MIVTEVRINRFVDDGKVPVKVLRAPNRDDDDGDTESMSAGGDMLKTSSSGGESVNHSTTVFHQPGNHNQKTHGNRAGRKNNIPSKTSKHAPLGDGKSSGSAKSESSSTDSSPDQSGAASDFDKRADNAVTGNVIRSELKIGRPSDIENENLLRGAEDYRLRGSSINTKLRRDRSARELTNTEEHAMRSMDMLIAESPTERDILVYRGLEDGNKIFGDAWSENGDNTGLEWVDDGFGSTSLDEKLITSYRWGSADSGVEMRILVPKGTGAVAVGRSSDTGSGGDEVTLGRKTRFRVVRDYDRGDSDGPRRTLDVEVIND